MFRRDMPTFECEKCQQSFTISGAVMAKYPGWKPKTCMRCKGGRKSGSGREENLSPSAVLEKYTEGPVHGIFVDGSAEPNPGSGGWGAVYVKDGQVIAQDYGHHTHTTNNRMELQGILEGCRLVPVGTAAVLYTDSQLCVNTFTQWAKKWEARGWQRKGKKGRGGEIKNLDLVQLVYDLLRRRPEIEIQWIRAHAGNRWNEYADSLATAYRRPTEKLERIGEKHDATPPASAAPKLCEECGSCSWAEEEVEGWVRAICEVCGLEVEYETAKKTAR